MERSSGCRKSCRPGSIKGGGLGSDSSSPIFAPNASLTHLPEPTVRDTLLFRNLLENVSHHHPSLHSILTHLTAFQHLRLVHLIKHAVLRRVPFRSLPGAGASPSSACRDPAATVVAGWSEYQPESICRDIFQKSTDADDSSAKAKEGVRGSLRFS